MKLITLTLILYISLFGNNEIITYEKKLKVIEMSKPLMPKHINIEKTSNSADIEKDYINATKELNLNLKVSEKK